MRDAASVPERHPATADAWAWLQSRTTQELPPKRRDDIARLLMETDEACWRLDRQPSLIGDPNFEPPGGWDV